MTNDDHSDFPTYSESIALADGYAIVRLPSGYFAVKSNRGEALREIDLDEARLEVEKASRAGVISEKAAQTWLDEHPSTENTESFGP